MLSGLGIQFVPLPGGDDNPYGVRQVDWRPGIWQIIIGLICKYCEELMTGGGLVYLIQSARAIINSNKRHHKQAFNYRKIHNRTHDRRSLSYSQIFVCCVVFQPPLHCEEMIFICIFTTWYKNLLLTLRTFHPTLSVMNLKHCTESSRRYKPVKLLSG